MARSESTGAQLTPSSSLHSMRTVTAAPSSGSEAFQAIACTEPAVHDSPPLGESTVTEGGSLAAGRNSGVRV